VFWLSIALGGALGACSRYAIGQWLGSRVEGEFPWSTLVVNIIGSALIAVCYVLLEERAVLNAWLKPLLMTGFLGALTTFSTFSMEAVLLAQKGALMLACGYVIANACGSILAFFAALNLMRMVV